MALAIVFWLLLKQTTTSRDIFILEFYLVAILQYLIDKVLRVFNVCGRRQVSSSVPLLDCREEIRLRENIQKMKYIKKTVICHLKPKKTKITAIN